MQIIFHFPDNDINLDISLIDNPGVKSWADHFLTNGYQASSHRESPFDYWRYNENLLKEHLDNINDRVESLKNLGYVYPHEMPREIDKITRFWTNTLHRFFTHNQRSVHDMIAPVDSTDKDLIDLQTRLTELLQEVNDLVHKIECYLKPEPETCLGMNEIYISHHPTFDQVGWWEMDPSWRKYHSRQHADLILGSQILGKTLIKSYIDGDNPNDWDTTGHYTNFGALQLQFGPKTRQEIYDRPDFLSWLNHWGLDYDTATFDYPIGNIINRDAIPVILKNFQEVKNEITVTIR